MDGQEDVPEIIALPQVRSRIPLIPRRSPPSTPPNQIRRKRSFIRRVDSSEESPSPHGSIFEALYQSTTNSDESGHIHSWPTRSLSGSNQPAAPRSDTKENDENVKKLPTATSAFITSDNQFLYGRGTVLDTITERNSLGSIRILARAKSADELHIMPISVHQGSFIPGKQPQRKKSLSLDELNLIKDYQDAVLVERKSKTPLAIHEIYAQPKVPIKEPPHRPQTPPGMPSWTEHQLRPPQLRQGRRTSMGLRQFFGIRLSKADIPQEQCLPNGDRSVSAPVGGRAPRIAKYRPPKSAYSRIDTHPFNSAPAAVVDPFLQRISPRPTGKRKSVRFTPSTTAQDSEVVHLQTRIAPSPPDPCSIAQIELISPIQSTTSRPVTPQKRKECPHRKGQRTVFERLKHSSSTIPGIDYQAILSSPLTRDESQASLPRLLPPSPTHPMSSGWPGRGGSNWDIGIIDTEPISGAASNSSTTHLMTGAIIAPSPSPNPRSTPPDSFALLYPSTKNSGCWRCKLETLGDKFAKLRKKSASCFWFVCCGFDPDDDESTYAPRNARIEFEGQATEFVRGGRAMDRWWGREESFLSPARMIVTDNSHHRIV